MQNAVSVSAQQFASASAAHYFRTFHSRKRVRESKERGGGLAAGGWARRTRGS